MDKLKDKWRDIVIVLLVISNLFLINCFLSIKREISSIEFTASDNKSEIHILKLGGEMLERKINNLTIDVEELQDANKYKPFW